MLYPLELRAQGGNAYYQLDYIEEEKRLDVLGQAATAEARGK
jgi:hypothetical protein